MKKKFRIEHDFIGEMKLPLEALYGIQTARALENFLITELPISYFPEMIVALAMVKKACALANRDLYVLDEGISDAIVTACDEIINGHHHEHFVVDLIQGGGRYLHQHERQ